MPGKLRFFWMMLFVCGICLPATAFPQTADVSFDLGVFACEAENWQQAEAYLQQALSLNPDAAHYHHWLGKVYYRTGRYDQAKEHLQKTLSLDPNAPGARYDLAQAYYSLGDYVEAGKHFQQVAAKEPDNVLAQYYSGICLFKRGIYDGALKYFTHASEKSPSITVNGSYYAGVCYLKTGRIDEGIKKLEYVRTNTDSQALKENADLWLEAARKTPTAFKPYDIYFKLSYQYDDNVVLEPDDQDLFADEADGVVAAAFAGRYRLIQKDALTFGLGYAHLQTWHDDLKTYDFIAASPNAFIRYCLKPLTLGFSYNPSYYWLDSEGYLARHEFRPEIVWNVDQNLAARLSYAYATNDYFDNNERDGYSHEINLDGYYGFWANRGKIKVGGGYLTNGASEDDQDYDRRQFRLALGFELPWKLQLDLSGLYGEKRYADESRIYGVKREDTRYEGGVSVSRTIIGEWLTFLLEFSHTTNDSNVDIFSYERNVTAASFAVTY